MPRRDGTGPNGMGPMTGRGAGNCTGYAEPGFANNTYGGFAGCGRGRGGRGFGRMSNCSYAAPVYGRGDGFGRNATFTSADEKEVLSQQAEYLGEQLEQINRRLSSLEEDK
ncbi:MAG TPA: DUF5320 domain-containing protein [Clostridia bacterium]|nr:DUF5320 domain-containing protein [Clostridia bacterium]